uniref:Tripeptidyl-peptidase II n=1 Tax=Tetraselmis sp. GSL018 TaxID=582737 RepID=A0A061SFF4_9CHLO
MSVAGPAVRNRYRFKSKLPLCRGARFCVTAMSRKYSTPDNSFRFRGAMPKDATGASDFLAANPDYDGRGVVVAIFDTGVDPGAAGLQVTSTGEPKILDVVDCTGSGDVDVSTVVEADEAGKLKISPGEHSEEVLLEINKAWHNPSGKWHVGCKRAFDLFPGPLVRKLKEHRGKRWAAEQRTAVAAATSALHAFNKTNPKPSSSSLQKEKAELELRVKLLEELEKSRSDLGPLVYCVVWHDGKTWRAALDTQELNATIPEFSGQGLLKNFEPLTDFAKERKFGTFSSLDACNFALNIYDEGNTLSIVVDAGSHGTHVAGITAAYHPEDPNLGSMETGPGLTRALIHVLNTNVITFESIL